MRHLVTVLLAVTTFVACSEDATGPEADMTGTFIGDYTKSIEGGSEVHEAVLQMTQSESGVTGTLTTSTGRAADVSGSITGSRLETDMTFTDDCGGSAAAKLDITDGGNRLVGNYAIADCGGTYSGGLDLARQ